MATKLPGLNAYYNAPDWTNVPRHAENFRSKRKLPAVTREEFQDEEFSEFIGGMNDLLLRAAANCTPYGRLHDGLFDSNWTDFEPFDRSVYFVVNEPQFVTSELITQLQGYLRKFPLWRFCLVAEHCTEDINSSARPCSIVYPNKTQFIAPSGRSVRTIDSWAAKCEAVFQRRHALELAQLGFLESKVAAIKFNRLPVRTPHCLLLTVTRTTSYGKCTIWTVQNRGTEEIRIASPNVNECSSYSIDAKGLIGKKHWIPCYRSAKRRAKWGATNWGLVPWKGRMRGNVDYEVHLDQQPKWRDSFHTHRDVELIG